MPQLNYKNNNKTMRESSRNIQDIPGIERTNAQLKGFPVLLAKLPKEGQAIVPEELSRLESVLEKPGGEEEFLAQAKALAAMYSTLAGDVDSIPEEKRAATLAARLKRIEDVTTELQQH